MARVWRSEDIFLKSVLSFPCVSPTDSSRFISVGGRHLFPLRHLADLEVKFLVIAISHSEVQGEGSRFLLRLVQHTHQRAPTCLPSNVPRRGPWLLRGA